MALISLFKNRRASEAAVRLARPCSSCSKRHRRARGKPTGEAYVSFKDAEEAQRALKERQHKHMGPRYIEIFEAVEADLVARSLSGGEAGPSLAGRVIRLRGLPFTSSAADVVEFFSGIEVVGGEAGVLFTCTPDSRPTGEAYVELGSEEAEAAALGRHKAKIGSRYIEIFTSSKADMYQAVQQHGFFTSVGGRRKHHWHQQHGGGGGGAHGGEGGPRAAAAAAASGGGVEEMVGQFAGFGLSQRDMQVPGPPRYGYGYGSSPDERHYGGRGPVVPPPSAAPGPQAWRQAAAMQQQQGMRMRPQAQQFNPAPGPPVKPGGARGGMGGGGHPGGGGMYDYGGQPTAIMVNPFMVQHPFMIGGQQGSGWGPGMMAPQQGGAWYGGLPAGRGGMQMGMAAPPYGSYAPQQGYYAASGVQRGMQGMAPGTVRSAAPGPSSSSAAPPGRGPVALSPPPGVRPAPPPAAPPPIDTTRQAPGAAPLDDGGGGGAAATAAGGEGKEGRLHEQHDSAASSINQHSARSSPVKLLGEGGGGGELAPPLSGEHLEQ
eukprot:scaffold8.g1529.t1